MDSMIWLTKEEFQLVSSLRGIMRTSELTRIVKAKTVDFVEVIKDNKNKAKLVHKFNVTPIVRALDEEINLYVGA